MESLVSVDPFRCRVWSAHDRLEENITEETCPREIESFKAHKQLKPALGRPVRDDPDYDVEVICGARRLFVARLLKMPFLVELRDLSDREAIIEMHVDRLRKDVSPYELAVGYLGWIRGHYFESQEEMSRVLKVSNSKVSRLLKLAQLPTVLVEAFDSAVNIRERWGLRLAKILENPQHKCLVIQAARDIQATTPRLSPRDVYKRLLASVAHTEPGHRKLNRRDHDKVVLGKDGTPLFRFREQLNSVALLLPIERISTKTLRDIEHAVQSILQNSLEQNAMVNERRRARRSSRTTTRPITITNPQSAAAPTSQTSAAF